MTLKDLRAHVDQTIATLKDHGKFPKENNLYDYKAKLNFYGLGDALEIFIRNFAKDILSFSNGNGGIIILGINEDKSTGSLEDVGLDKANLELLEKVDLSYVTQKFEKICKVGLDIDLQMFQLGTRKFYFLLIEKQNQVVIPINDFSDYGLKRGEITYRVSGKNETANHSAQEFNRFLQIKSNEKSKEFMEIWSKLLPEMFDINPREILIINPKSNRVYGFNGKDNVLSSSDVEIDKSDNGVFNIILSAISAGEIGKISDNEGKPLYKIVGEVKSVTPREFMSMSTLEKNVKDKSKFKFTNQQLKTVIKHLGWVDDEHFKVVNPPEGTVNEGFDKFLWVEILDTTKKVVYSKDSIDEILKVIDDSKIHQTLFNKNLDAKRALINS
ncbi:MAG: RNA-binding domain-containing protein [Janthinobacterium lividum]